MPARVWHGAALAGVLLIALAVRLWGNDFGLPFIYHPDEGFEVYRALRLGTGEFDMERVAKGGYYLVLFAEYGLYFVWLTVSGVVKGVEQFAYHFVRDPSPFWMIGRTTTAVLGMATVFLVWFQGRRMKRPWAGLLGAAFLALSFQHVLDSHYVTVDVPMTFFSFWAVLLIAEDASGRRRLKPWFFAIVAAAAMLNKLPAGVLFLPYFLAAFLRGGFRRAGGLLTVQTWLPVSLTAMIYVLVNPGIVVHFFGIFGDILNTLFRSSEATGEYAGVEQRRNLWLFYGLTLLKSQGPALMAAALFGAWFACIRGSRTAWMHAAFVVPFFCLIAGASSAHLYYERYITPLLPGLCLFAGLALDDLLKKLPGPALSRAFAGVAVTVLLLAEPGMAVMRSNARMSRVDTRTQAVAWVEENVRPGTRILLEGHPEELSQLSVPLRDTEDNVLAMVEELRERDLGKARFWEMKLATSFGPTFDLLTVRHFEPWGSLDEYLEEQVEYVIVPRGKFVAGERDVSKLSGEAIETRRAFYEELSGSAMARRVASFDASDDGFPGLDLEVWRLRPLTSAGS